MKVIEFLNEKSASTGLAQALSDSGFTLPEGLSRLVCSSCHQPQAGVVFDNRTVCRNFRIYNAELPINATFAKIRYLRNKLIRTRAVLRLVLYARIQGIDKILLNHLHKYYLNFRNLYVKIPTFKNEKLIDACKRRITKSKTCHVIESYCDSLFLSLNMEKRSNLLQTVYRSDTGLT